MKNILIQAWTVHFDDKNYYLPYTHWVYLNEIVKYFDNVSLLSPTLKIGDTAALGLVALDSFPNVNVIELPHSDGYVNTIKHFFTYYRTYKNLDNFDSTYARYPVPFGWLQKLFFKNAKRIIHFVGDPIDAAKHNPNFGRIKKAVLISFFMPEHLMYIWACKGAKVYTNGYHLAERLKKYGVSAVPLISSTLNERDFYFDIEKSINTDAPKLLYVGYLRKAKGVETVVKAFQLLQARYPKAELTIVGSGEFDSQLKQMALNNRINNIVFLGHIDDRARLNSILRSHDIFCFASLSEGSPRVILEAMANGIIVVSTPVGSLPYIFKDEEDIVFADFNNAEMFCKKMISLIENKQYAVEIKERAYKKVHTFTIAQFLKNIFDES